LKKYKYTHLERDYLKQGKPLPEDVNEFFERLAAEKFPNHAHLTRMFKEARIGKMIGSFHVIDVINTEGLRVSVEPIVFHFRKGICIDAKIIKNYVNAGNQRIEGYFEATIRNEMVDMDLNKSKKKDRVPKPEPATA